ncbi:MAG: universal stress protein [Deltaproteobacteria bacterium]|nr:universal stress protein [Deltaproteobacteria bacterium]MBW2417616.1 universal stress protein [Deltaproteobacteria bacterium]
MIETISVATDGSEAATAAERCAISLAARLRVGLAGITVVEDSRVRAPNGEGLTLPPFPESELAAYYRARAEAVARRLSERARSEGVEATCEVVQGQADDRIVEKSQSVGLLAIGRDGRAEAQRGALIGSTTDSVIRKASKSILVVPGGASLGGPIVLGFDGSPGSRIAAGLAVELANGLGEAVHVFVDSKDKGRAVARFEEVRKLVGGLSVPVREMSSTLGRPDVKIIDTARESHAGLIVMGAFGRNRITDYFLGSNAAAVVRTSPLPVLLAR